MNPQFTYQQLFQSLKGVRAPILNSLVLPVPDTNFVLSPIGCADQNIDESIVEMLTIARNANAESFLTMFNATVTRTRLWLTNIVATDETRILFVVKNLTTGEFYGYMGLAYGNDDGSYIEADAIVRTDENIERGLMKRAFRKMVKWIHLEVGVSQIWVRVLSDNPAVEFYRKTGFEIQDIKHLYKVLDANGCLIELSVDSLGSSRMISQRTLSYMKLKDDSL